MKRKGYTTFVRMTSVLTAVMTAACAAPLSAGASSMTDLEQQAEDMVNQSVMKSETAKTQEGTQEETTEEPQETETDANTADITGTAADSYETVTIRTVEEFQELAANCHYDSWSRDKQVLLEADLDFSREEFTPIESFGGIFDGQGHTISGISITDDTSETGVFGTVQNTGIVSDLKVQGMIVPSGTQGKLGGVAGINYGQITDCSFDGRLEGDSELGGIAGRNGRLGTISSCSASGAIVGTSSCGGIAGYNEGTILDCTNESNVNTTYQDSNRTVDQLSTTIEKILTSGDLNSFENLEINADTGGIAGFSSGVIASCTNEAEIGYTHVGYNVGGIVGRSSGFLQNNTNNGTVYGRKDVGGIAGQMQPYLSLDFTEDALSRLDSQLDQLNSLVNTGLDNADSYSANTQNHLTNITGLARTAQDAVKGMADEGADQYDQAADKINTAVSAAQSSLSSLSGAAGKLTAYLEKVEGSMSALGSSAGTYLKGLNLSQEDKAAVEQYAGQFTDGVKKVQDGLQELSELTLDGPSVEDADSDTQQQLREQVSNALTEIREGYQEMDGAVEGMVEILSKAEYQDNQEVQDALSELKDTQSSLKELQEEIADTESELNVLSSQEQQNAFTNGNFSTGDLNSLITELTGQQADLLQAYPDLENPELDPDTHSDEELAAWFVANYGLSKEDAADYAAQYRTSREQYDRITGSIAELAGSAAELGTDPAAVSNWLDENADELQKLLEQIQSGLSDQESSLGGLLQIVKKYGENALDTSDLSSSLQNAANALKSSPDVTSSLTGALDTLASLDLKLNGISETLRANGTNLYDAMSQLNSEMQSLGDALSTETGEGLDNLRAISDQFNTIMKTLQDAAEDLTDTSNDSIEDVSGDISEDEISGTYQGRTTACTNYGEVNGDTNVGGITGMIGVEYDLDPETDIKQSGTTSLDYIFRAKCIADHCTNRGKVTARSNYCGGIAGHMEMGLAADNASYESIEGGNYVGGITGYSVGAVRDNAVKCEISGARYVGGIAGYGVTLRDNLAMVTAAEATQYVGAIAGRVKNIDSSQVSGNYYYSDDMYGIDGVSYEGIAESVSYEKLIQMDGIPDSFLQLVLTFRADGNLVKTIACSYGTAVSEDQIPEIPEKEGFHSQWSKTDYSEITSDEVIEAQYSRINTLLVSGEKRSSGKSTIEVEGSFWQDDTLVVTLMRPEEGEEERWMVSVPEDGADTHQIRFLPADTASHPVIYLIRDGKKTKVETESFGQYLTFEAEGTEVTFCVENGGLTDRLPLLIGTMAAAAAAILVLVHGALKRRRRDKEQHLRSGRRKNGSLASDGRRSDKDRSDEAASGRRSAGGRNTGRSRKKNPPQKARFDESEWLDDEV